MKEVKEKRYAGPFRKVPFKNFIQSPIGLVPKDNGKEFRLIFHLSYPRGKGTSVNENTPVEDASVVYPDFNDAIQLSLKLGRGSKISRSDMKAAFRNLGIKRKHWKYLVMKAKSPIDHKTYYFMDKCLPFGASISCSHFQRFSNAVAHIMKCRTNMPNINYLDDYLFAAMLKMMCDWQVQKFLDLCQEIGFPVNMDKTFWGTTLLTFLGLLIDKMSDCIHPSGQDPQRLTAD